MNENKSKVSLKQWLHYQFDNMMSKGSIALIGWLGLISLIIIIGGAAILILAGIKPENSTENFTYLEAIWMSMMRALSSGNLGKDEGWAFRIVMLFVTLGGVFVVSTLIGILNNGIRKTIDNLRKGHSLVIESGHTLILGWSTKTFPIIRELIIGNENHKNPRIVILAEKEKEKVEDEIRQKITDRKNTKIICRSGNLLDADDLRMVNPIEAKSIIITSPETENPDTYVIKTILAITNDKNRKKEPYHIIAEIKEKSNMEVAKIVGKDDVTFVLSRDVISRIIVQTSLQSGLSVVYQELLDFKGSEIYFHEEEGLHGKTFKETLFAFNTSCPIGVYYKDDTLKINPPMDTKINKGDKLILISEDDVNIRMNGGKNVNIEKEIIKPIKEAVKNIENVLILGWNQEGRTIIKELDNYLCENSNISVVARHHDLGRQLLQIIPELKNVTVTYKDGDITKRDVLISNDVNKFDHIIVLCYSDLFDSQKADAIILITLLHLRDIASKYNIKLNVVSEVMEIKNKKLAEVTRADDFIISDHMISLLMTQISENKKLKDVFDDLFNAEGSEIYLKPVENYIETGKEVDFNTILEAAALRNEVAIGYRQNQFIDDEEKYYGVTVNPDKTKKVLFGNKDKIIVLAEEE
jgi:ion channel POLLUX/CASTOR